MITANWSIISNEGSFEKKKDNGYLVFSQNGTFSVIYYKGEEEARVDFYSEKSNSTDKKSVCECKITTRSGADRTKKSFDDITTENVWDIVATFFDYCDLEKSDKNVVDKFLMGFSKSIKGVLKSEEKDQLPPSFKVFSKYIKDWSNNIKLKTKSDTEEYDFSKIIEKFVSYYKSSN